MNRRTSLVLSLVLFAATAPTTIGVATAAHAASTRAPAATSSMASAAAAKAVAPASCRSSQYKKKRALRASISRKYVMIEQRRVEISPGSSYERSVSWNVQETKTNSWKISGSVTGKFKAAVWAEVEVQAGGEYGNSNTTSTFNSGTEIWKLSAPGVWRVVRGFETFTAKVPMLRCLRKSSGAVGPDGYSYYWAAYPTATLRGFNQVDSSIKCKYKYKKGTFNAFAKKRLC